MRSPGAQKSFRKQVKSFFASMKIGAIFALQLRGILCPGTLRGEQNIFKSVFFLLVRITLAEGCSTLLPCWFHGTNKWWKNGEQRW